MRFIKQIFKHMLEDTQDFFGVYLYGIIVGIIVLAINIPIFLGVIYLCNIVLALGKGAIFAWGIFSVVTQICLTVWMVAAANRARKTIQEENRETLRALGQNNEHGRHR